MTADLKQAGQTISDLLADELGLTNGAGTDNPSVTIPSNTDDKVRVYAGRITNDKESARELRDEVAEAVSEYGLTPTLRTSAPNDDAVTHYQIRVSISRQEVSSGDI